MKLFFAFAFFALSSLLVVPLLAQEPNSQIPLMKYPESQQGEVVDDYHGREVADPYRWLEDTESEDTAAWVASQNELTRSYLESLPEREPMRAKLEQFWNYERYGLPRKGGDRYFYSHNDGLQDQSVLYQSPTLSGSLDASNAKC